MMLCSTGRKTIQLGRIFLTTSCSKQQLAISSSSLSLSSIRFRYLSSYASAEKHDDCNGRYKHILKICKTKDDKGWGLFAMRNFDAGEFIMTSNGNMHQHQYRHRHSNKLKSSLSQDDGARLRQNQTKSSADSSLSSSSHSIQINWNEHILPELPAILINHSCHANVGIRNGNSYNRSSNNMNNNSSDEDQKDSIVPGEQESPLPRKEKAPPTTPYYDFEAIRPIKKGEELTWDYEAAEWELSTPFRCNCGNHCRSLIRGYKYHGPIIRQKYGPIYYADYLKE